MMQNHRNGQQMNEAQSYSHKDIQDAFKTLGLTVGDYAGVDKAYKALARKNHPDLGGNVETMKVINNAKDALEHGQKITNDQQSRETFWKETNQKYKEGNEALLKSLLEKLLPYLDKYSSYFKEKTGSESDFVFHHKEVSSTSGSTLSAEWLNADKSRYFTMTFWLNFRPVAGALGSSDMKEFSAVYDSYMFIDGKKFKVKRNSWTSLKFNAEEFEKPETIFPPDKIGKAVKVGKEKPIKRADFQKFLKLHFDSHDGGDTDWQYIPLGKYLEAPHALALHRMVFMRTPAWTISSIAGKVGKGEYAHYNTGSKFSVKTGLKYNSFAENRKFMEALPEIVKKAKEASDSNDATHFQSYLDSIRDDINKDESFVDLTKNSAYDQSVLNEGATMKSLSEQFLKLSEENDKVDDGEQGATESDVILKPVIDASKNEDADALDTDVILNPMLDIANPSKDDKKIVEQDENDNDPEVPQRLAAILKRLSRKTNAVKVEMQDTLIKDLLNIIQGLPAGNRLLRGFIKDAAAIVLKGEDLSDLADQ